MIDTVCIYKNKTYEIKNLINEQLSNNYDISYPVINLKNYGSDSSRTRALIIGTRKDICIPPTALYPKYRDVKLLYEMEIFIKKRG